MARLADGGWIARHENLLITGPTGLGSFPALRDEMRRKECNMLVRRLEVVRRGRNRQDRNFRLDLHIHQPRHDGLGDELGAVDSTVHNEGSCSDRIVSADTSKARRKQGKLSTSE